MWHSKFCKLFRTARYHSHSISKPTIWACIAFRKLDYISSAQWDSSISIFTARKRSLGQSNIFSSVYQEFCSQVGGGVCLSACWDTTTPRTMHPLGPDTPPDQGPPLRSACWEIRSTSGRYACYWNAILYFRVYDHSSYYENFLLIYFLPVHSDFSLIPLLTNEFSIFSIESQKILLQLKIGKFCAYREKLEAKGNRPNLLYNTQQCCHAVNLIGWQLPEIKFLHLPFPGNVIEK